MQNIFRGLINITLLTKFPHQHFATETAKKTVKKTATKSTKKVKETPTKEKMSKRQKKAASTNDYTENSKSAPKKNIKKQQSLGEFFKIKSTQAEPITKEVKLGTGIFEGKNSLLISSWNINGIRAIINKDVQKDAKKEKEKEKQRYLKEYIENIQPDIFCINESKIDESMFDKEKVMEKIPFIDQYNSYWNFCKPPTKGYSGVAVFSKVPPISVQNDMGIEKHDQEGRLITLEYLNFYLVATYVPNAGQGLKRLDYRTEEWDVDFQKYLNNLKEKKNVILTGDLNVAHNEIDLANPKGNVKSAGFTKEERKSFSNFLDNGWIDTFRYQNPDLVKYSYFSMRANARSTGRGWRLDYFVVNDKFMDSVIKSDINNDYYGSDHTPIEMSIKNVTQQENSEVNENEQQQQQNKNQDLENQQKSDCEQQNNNNSKMVEEEEQQLQQEQEQEQNNPQQEQEELDLSQFAFKKKSTKKV